MYRPKKPLASLSVQHSEGLHSLLLLPLGPFTINWSSFIFIAFRSSSCLQFCGTSSCPRFQVLCQMSAKSSPIPHKSDVCYLCSSNTYLSVDLSASAVMDFCMLLQLPLWKSSSFKCKYRLFCESNQSKNIFLTHKIKIIFDDCQWY